MTTKMQKNIAVVIFNLGGPDSRAAIKPFLFNFFMDKNIIRLPLLLRWIIAKLISIRRSKKEAGDSYSLLGNKSPLLENTQAQAAALEEVLNKNADGVRYKTYIAMRYWHPLSNEIVAQIKKDQPDHIVLLPFYPQYSTTTTRSSLGAWKKAAKKVGLKCSSAMLCCYPFFGGFVKASADNICKTYNKALEETACRNLPPPRLLFSAHGLPEEFIKDGDPYQWQCEQSAAAIAAALNIPALDWNICYQSRVGPKKWLGPSTEEELERAAKDNVPVVIYPHAFVNEHVETLVEIEMEYRELAEKMGVPWFGRVETVSVHPDFITGLADMVRALVPANNPAHDPAHKITSSAGDRLCPSDYKRCCMKECSLQTS